MTARFRKISRVSEDIATYGMDDEKRLDLGGAVLSAVFPRKCVFEGNVVFVKKYVGSGS